MNSILPIPGIRPRAGGTDILLTVRDDMTLLINPAAIAMAGNHNSATFIVTQPTQLDALACRAEVRTIAGTSYRLVQNGEFALTADIAVPGIGQMQLVYGDGDINIKTTVAQFFVAPSLDALDQSNPDFQDGLAQLADRAFADAGTVGTQLVFVNIGGREVARVQFPGSGLDEEQADRLYLRLDGTTNAMQGSVIINGNTRGVVFNPPTNGSAIYGDNDMLRLRRPAGNAEVQVEDNNGLNRSPIVTQTSGDARYTTYAYADGRYADKSYVDSRFLPIDGGQIVGPIRQLAAESPATVETLVTRGYVNGEDAKYLPLAGGQLTGSLSMAPSQRIISAMGAGNQPMLCIGSNDSGFWRTGGSIIFEIGFGIAAIFSVGGNTFYGPITLPGAPTANLQAATKAYVDAGDRAATAAIALGTNFPLSSTFQSVMVQPYSIPRGGNSRVMVTVAAGLRFATQSQLGMVQVRVLPGGLIRNCFVYSVDDAPSGGIQTSGFVFSFFIDVTGTNPAITTEMRLVGNTPPLELLGGAAEPQHTVVTYADMGPR